MGQIEERYEIKEICSHCNDRISNTFKRCHSCKFVSYLLHSNQSLRRFKTIFWLLHFSHDCSSTAHAQSLLKSSERTVRSRAGIIY